MVLFCKIDDTFKIAQTRFFPFMFDRNLPETELVGKIAERGMKDDKYFLRKIVEFLSDLCLQCFNFFQKCMIVFFEKRCMIRICFTQSHQCVFCQYFGKCGTEPYVWVEVSVMMIVFMISICFFVYQMLHRSFVNTGCHIDDCH